MFLFCFEGKLILSMLRTIAGGKEFDKFKILLILT